MIVEGVESTGEPGPRMQVHQFMVLQFAGGIDAGRQEQVMAALDAHLGRCEGLRSADTYRDKGGRWVKHLVWQSQKAIDAAAGLDEDPEAAELFRCFSARSFAYPCLT